MTTERRELEILGMPVDVIRKDIKHLHLAVYPPNGRVRVAAPLRLDDDAVRLAVIARLPWIRRRQAAFAGQPRESARDLVTGESHYVAGRRYRLDVVEHAGRPTVRLRNNRILELRVPPDTGRQWRQALLERWYRRRLREHIAELLEKWEPLIGVTVAAWGIKRMKTHWGTCNVVARRLWLNLELAKKPPACIEYILVHELVHLLERHHNDRFQQHLDRLLPSWRRYRDELNRLPLAHADWRY